MHPRICSSIVCKIMSKRKLGSFTLFAFFTCIQLLSFSFLQLVQYQLDEFSPPQLPSSASLDLLTQLAYSRLDNLTSDILSSKLVQDYSFCIQNPEAEWNSGFNYSSDLSFLTACLAKIGDVAPRLCTAAEVSGCEPGWACSTGSEDPADIRNSQVIPAREFDCQPCCEGFFCPNGITCMILVRPTSYRFDSHYGSTKCKQFCENFSGLLLSKMGSGSICYFKFRTIPWCVAPDLLWCSPQAIAFIEMITFQKK